MKLSSAIHRLALVALVLVLAAPAAMAAQAGLRSDLELVQAGPDGVVVLLSLTNVSGEDLMMLEYETPLEGLEADLFRVERDGQAVPYVGPMIMRAGPVEGSWLRLAAGETVAVKVDLTDAYDLSAAGSYSIEYVALQHLLVGSEQAVAPVARPLEAKTATLLTLPATVVSSPVEVRLEGVRAPRQLVDLIEPVHDGSPKDSYPGCDAGEIADVQDAKADALTNACCSCDYCAANGCGSRWYQTWFGPCTYESTVCTNFCDACSVLGDDRFQLNCGGSYCEPGVIAYVYQNRSYEIWLCPDFFVYNNMQVHAIDHEVFHWNIVAGAEDWGYGSKFCKDLAKYYDPAYAATNADSYAYACDGCR
jgi:peptidyl-Lys metalloendopeptidase